MKKIIVLLVLSFLLTSCFGEKNEVIEKKGEKQVLEIKNNISKLEDLVNNQNFDKAIPELEKLYLSNSNEISNILNYMSALLAKGSITRQEKEYSTKALKIGNKALKLFPNNSELYRYIGYAYEIVEDYNNSFVNYNKSIELDKNNALAYANRGHAYRLYGDYSNAEKDFLKAYELNPNDDFVLVNLGWLNHSVFFEKDKALKFYKKAVLNTKNIRFKAEAYHTIGNILIGKGKYSDAEIAFKNAIKADQKFELGYLGLSEVQMLKLMYRSKDKTKEQKIDLLQEALKNNELAIALNPSRAISYFKKALILKDIKGQEKESKLLFKIALDISKTDITLGKKEKEGLKKFITNFTKNEK